MSYAGLSNEQIVFIYLRLNKYANYVNELVMEGYMNRRISIDFDEINIESEVTDEDLNSILDIPLVKLYMGISETLKPIAELIKESEPDMYYRIEKILEEADNGNFLDDEESSEEDED